jgi:hypothetical protein
MPACLPEDNLCDFVKKMVGDGNAAQENNIFSFPMDESARAKEGIHNPIAHVQEFMAVAHSLLSVVIGIVPENFFSQMTALCGKLSLLLILSIEQRAIGIWPVLTSNLWRNLSPNAPTA